MNKDLRDLWLLAGWAAFAMGSIFLAGSWHIQTYSIVH
jgi:hypothetical protein